MKDVKVLFNCSFLNHYVDILSDSLDGKRRIMMSKDSSAVRLVPRGRGLLAFIFKVEGVGREFRIWNRSSTNIYYDPRMDGLQNSNFKNFDVRRRSKICPRSFAWTVADNSKKRMRLSFLSFPLIIIHLGVSATASSSSPSSPLTTTATCSTEKMAPKIKLTYFAIEGAAECVRLTCRLAGLEFDDVQVQFSEWPAMKPTTPHGTLPLMQIDDGPVRVQSQAMVRYLASEYSETLYPKDKLFDIEEVIGLAGDFSRAWGSCLYVAMSPESFGHDKDFAKTDAGKAKIKEMREAFCKDDLPKFLNYFTAMLDKNDGKWLASTDAPTIADCITIPMLRAYTKGHIDHVPTTILDSHPKIVDYIKRFCALPEIAGHYTTGLHE